MDEQPFFQSPVSNGRKVRPEHERENPFRNASQILDGAKRLGGSDDDVAAGVRGAYDVVEKYLSEGADLAMKLGGMSYGALDDVGDLGTRVGLLSSELMANWFELLGVLSDAMLNSTDRPVQQSATAKPAPQSALQVDGASRPCSITIDLHREVAPTELTCPGLIAVTGGQSLPVTLSCSTSGMLVVRVSIGEDQTAGAYHGVLLDRSDFKPCGLLRLDIVE